MIIDRIDSYADGLAGRYNAHLMSLEGLLRRYVEQPNLDSQSQRDAFRDDLWFQSAIFSNDELSRLRTEFWATVTPESHEHESFVRASEVALASVLDSFASQMRRDSDVIVKYLADMSLRINMTQRQRGWSRSASIVAVKQEFNSDIKYSFVDRSGKHWDSTRYIRTLVRGALLTAYNESLLYVAAMSGKNRAYVHNANTEHKAHGTSFLITPTGEGQTYNDIRGAIFHPNSQSYVSLER